MGEHTPDEFEIVDCRHQKGGQIRIWARGHGHIANVLASGPNPMGHARLFAAAPELLEVIREAFHQCDVPELWLRQARTALDKAGVSMDG